MDDNEYFPDCLVKFSDYEDFVSEYKTSGYSVCWVKQMKNLLVFKLFIFTLNR